MRFQEDLTFYLNGKMASGTGTEALELLPALLARYRRLEALRHDYPLVLFRGEEGPEMRPLSALLDDALEKLPRDEEGDRLRYRARRMEQEIRKNSRDQVESLSTLWEQAQAEIAGSSSSREPGSLKEDLARLREMLPAVAQVIDCGPQAPSRALKHLWEGEQARKAARLGRRIDRLLMGLENLLRADEAASAAGLSANRLRESMGPGFASEFDFKSMSQLLTALPHTGLPESRRERIRQLIHTLKSQRFFPTALDSKEKSLYEFTFTSCAEALRAYYQRLPRMIALAKAILMAELEVEGTYREDVHDSLFRQMGISELEPLQEFPDYLIYLNVSQAPVGELFKLIEALSAGLSIKVLLQIDDLRYHLESGNGHPGGGIRSEQLARMALGLGDVFVLQAPASHLARVSEHVRRGLRYPGPALFCVYSGAQGRSEGFPPYLMAAAALESRAFPLWVYDPAAGPDWASRFSVEGNPRPEQDWPMHQLTYEDAEHQRRQEEIAFTPVDFLALDPRLSGHLSPVPPDRWHDRMVPVAVFLEEEAEDLPQRVPYLLMVDSQDRLHRVLVTRKLIQEAQRYREHWHALRELGGVCNSFVERAVAEERRAWEEELARQSAETPPEVESEQEAPVEAAVAEETVSEEAPSPTRSPDEPYIETERCSSCNECIQINDRMFRYNENKQAYIADLSAGTYEEIVRAAERCQLAIIHPGKPWNPDEPNLEELMKRAEPFL
ncbi:MAG: hypothetical protein D6681_00710 [Calditrichaeota bacterium]|nr:MAG: hypothetical protein D6681_00710 [Calditrichota bacterium]